MYLPFEKWQGCLNDFIVIWLADSDGDVVLDSIKRQARMLCDRHASIGADGILVLKTYRSQDLTPYGLTIINSDASIAKTCGNGLRCAARSVLKAHKERGHPQQVPELPELIDWQVEGESIICRFIGGGSSPLVVVEMGVPTLNAAVPWYGAAQSELARVAKALGLQDLARDFGVCTIGNPHLVVWTDAAAKDLLSQVGPLLQQSSAWDGINVHLAKQVNVTAKDQARAGNDLGQGLSEAYQVFVWERGAGETMACGSGACAVAALALHTGLVERDAWIAIDMPGGRLYVKHPEPNAPVLLAGPAAYCFSGRVPL